GAPGRARPGAPPPNIPTGDNIAKYEEIPFGVIDAQRVQQISANNPFVSDDICPDDNIAKNQNSHLYILPSYFNHSCLPNAFRSFFGDIIAIHASEDIKKGDEIFLPYLYPLNAYLERKNTIMARGFICQCKLCELDANDPNCLIRDQMLKKLKDFKKDYTPNFVVANGEPILKKIRESYVNRNELKVVLAQALVILGSAYFNTQKSSRAITCLEEAVSLMNNNPLKYSMRIADICVNIGTCYLSSGNRRKFNDITGRQTYVPTKRDETR
uniref:SET domain-containing protein n=1 Tax=Panagrolaimus sp. PS1159 TaxID=55785 RepID=A0AC35EVQ2_9BILA